MFEPEDFMSSFAPLQKNSELGLDSLDDDNWLADHSDLQCELPDVNVCDQTDDFPVVPPFPCETTELDHGTALFDVGLAKPELLGEGQQTSSSSSLESWQGANPRPKALSRVAMLQGGMRRVETAASALTSMEASVATLSPIARVTRDAMRPSHSLPDLVKYGDSAARSGRGRNSTVSTSPPKNLGVDTRTPEQRREDRMVALERFREKKRNRTFTKKVRYECRKQLADSRPRVKGRFVKKNEIGLYEKYGEAYHDHLDELEAPALP